MTAEYGILCLLPPIVAIVLALITKQTILSLVVAAYLGAVIVNGWNPLVGVVRLVTDYFIPQLSGNAGMIILVTLAGGMIAMMRQTGAAQAFAKKVSHSIDTPKKGQIVTSASAFIFCYTEPCLMLGTIMRPLCDTVRISRAKVAYILDSLGCNLACISPISSYGPFITGLIAAELLAAGVSGSEWSIWAKMIPYNLYGIFAMLTVFVVAIFGLDFGMMRTEELRARETGKVIADDVEPLVPEVKVVFPEGYEPTMMNFLVPLLFLFGSIFATIFYTGDLAANGLAGCFRSANITAAISVGFIGGAVGAGLVGVFTGLFNAGKAFSTFVDGMGEMINVPFILVCAWSLGAVTKQMEVGAYMVGIVESFLTPKLVPAFIFLFGALISFATGSSWGVWSIMMPIACPMAFAFDIPIEFVVGAVISGGLFGDQCSPVSDTTVMSSTGGSCNHIVHVMTQLPYGITVGAAAFLGFLAGGLTGAYMLSIAVTAVVLFTGLALLTRLSAKKDTAA